MRRLTILAVLTCSLAASGQMQTEVTSAPCEVAPRIDGVIRPGEWPDTGHLTWSMPLTRLTGPVAPRQVELWVQNSRKRLYVAFRVPDPERHLTKTVADFAVLTFCRGAELAAGDDRKAVTPGGYADKHFLSPGKQADDRRKNGLGAMLWHPAQGGYYDLEWQLPLDSGDPEDLQTTPGQRVRFNLVYVDGFRAGGEGMEFGGVCSNSIDNAKDWGEITLAEPDHDEAPAPLPPGVAALFPQDAAPDHVRHRFRIQQVRDLVVDDGLGAVVTVAFDYRALSGRTEVGQANLFLPPALVADPTTPRPLVHQAGYSIDDGAALPMLRQGWIISNPHGHPLNPLSRGPQLDQALLHAMRAQSWVDGRRILIQGGSAGGWTTLMMAAETFPIVGAIPAVPPLDWGYEAAYIATGGHADQLATDPEQSKTPVLTAVKGVTDQLAQYYGMPFESDVFQALSPVAQLETITAPIQVHFSPADMLVPIDQVSAKLVQPHDPAVFSEGFTSSPAVCLPGRPVKTLAEALPADRAEWFTPELPPVAERVHAHQANGHPPLPLVLPFSKDRQWSVIILDEGPQEPTLGHLKYHWALNNSGFRDWVMARGPQPEQLTPDKLRRLMLRVQGKPYLTGRVKPEGADQPHDGCFLDFPEAERADVLQGLRSFADDDACALRLAEVYAELADELKVFGPTLGETPEAVRAALDGRLGD